MAYLVNYLLLFYFLSVGGAAMCGMGLFVMGRTIELRRLFILAITASALITFIWLTPVTHFTRNYLMIFLLIILLYRTTGYSMFICTGAVLIGYGILLLLEYMYTSVIFYIFLAEFSYAWPLRILRGSPGALTGIALAVLAQGRMKRKPPAADRFEDFSAIGDKEQLRVLRIVPLAQLFTSFLAVVVAWSIPGTFSFFSESFLRGAIGRLLLVIPIGLILLCAYLTGKYYASRRAPVSPADLVDLVLSMPLICLAIALTGGAASPWKVLFIPLIVTNALKRHSAYGIISIILSALALVLFGVLQPGGVWPRGLDLFFITAYIFVFWVIRSFISMENVLNTELEGARRNLLTSISHDLRTPITLIQGYTEALLNRVDVSSESRSKYLQLVLNRTNDLKRLARDLAELVQLETRSISLNLNRVSPQEILDQVYSRYEHDIKNKGLNLEAALKTDYGDITVEADPDRLDRVFANLIFNALKHTPVGGTVTIRTTVSMGGKEVIFSLSDTGPGINKEELPMVFDRFYKGSCHRGSPKGSGLGLAIAKEIVEFHGGNIWAESKEGQGSTFYFTLPVRGAGEERATKKRPGQVRAPATVPLAQLVTALIVIAALVASGAILTPPSGAVWVLLSVLGVLYAVPAVRRRRAPKASLVALFGSPADLIILVPAIYHVLVSTGSSSSPWKVLFIPFIITNTLKPDKIHGPAGATIAAFALLLSGITDLVAGAAWVIEQDLAYISLFAVIHLVIRHFMSVEASLNRELAESRRALLTGVASELQTPMSAIGDNIKVLINGGLDREESRAVLATVHGQVIRLSRLIGDLFELVQLESRRSVLHLLHIPVLELVRRSLGKHESSLKETGVAVELSVPDGYPPKAKLRVQADPDRLGEVFTHLLTAAAAGAERGSFAVHFALDDRGEEVLFRIQKRDPEAFEAVSGIEDSFASRDYSGRLGVLIAEQIIKLHGGRILTEWSPGQESGFSFTLPLAT